MLYLKSEIEKQYCKKREEGLMLGFKGKRSGEDTSRIEKRLKKKVEIHTTERK